ncbi:SNF2 family helicase [Chitinophagaceae bacterium LB-8]|uniref:SNF2 family helicase n=1 Tax=Paraflavisolibacter caeni TaxID=2982496 RepID=A0A9X2Y176_9BACT|nr:DEAD/DEAH box helicase [Paraflavisolibacter caeni]MCU7551328.1 SNF2 family helicase [Paraflavisolibacter caeni]
MASIKELQEQLLTSDEKKFFIKEPFPGKGTVIIVLKNYRFHKQLTIELYEAPTTQSGKIKNPLTPINPSDVALKVQQSEEIRYFSAISRFQNNPTASKSPLDIDALKSVVKNPMGFRVFYHNPEFSEHVVAGSLQEVSIGATIHDVILTVSKQKDLYEIIPQVTIDHRTYRFNEISLKYDYFILVKDTMHLLGNFHLLKVARFFQQQWAGLRVHESKFKEFQQQIINKLEDHVTVVYNYIQQGTVAQIEESSFRGPGERLIYLSDLDRYVMINPVMKYGEIEIPVLTKKQIYAQDGKGELFNVQRNVEEEVRFTALLMKQHAYFEEQLDDDLPYFYMHKQRFLDEDWFLNAFEQWQNAGITVLGFNQLKGNKYNSNKAKISVQVRSGLNWFNTEVNVRFGNKRASLKQLHQSVRNKNRFVQLDDGTFGILPQEWLEKFENYFNAADISGEELLTPKINFSSVKKLYQEEELDEEARREINLYETKLSHFDSIQEAEAPQELNASLRHYQIQGLSWLNFLDDYNFGGCLADDMGLGKTLQIIAFVLLQRKKAKHNTNLVVVPTSLIFNWQAEVQKYAPSIMMHTIYGSNRVRHTKELDQYEIVLTSYGTLLSDITYLKNYTFNYIFLDESQNIKNIESQRYAAVRLLKSRNKIAITGTPVENNTLDLYAQLSFACPGLLGSKQSFKYLFSIPIDQFKSSKRSKELQQKVAPFVLRRSKKDVAKELPEKTEMVLYCPMGEAQRKVYEVYEKELRDFIEGKLEDELNKNSIHILRGMTRLRQICNSPLLLQDEKLYGDESSKIETLIEQIENKSSVHKILVFSQFVSMLDLIKEALEKSGIKYESLTGRTKDREAIVSNFQNNENVRVFLISLKAGGTGLNLTEADYVYLVDPWWNPAVENQAIDRSYRIGQKKNVVAVRLICPDTVEEKIMKLQEAKRGLSDDLIKTESTFFKSISKSEWIGLLGGETTKAPLESGAVNY